MTEDQGTAAPGKTFVLVHGAWHGGWCWRRVAALLQRRGHNVFTPTLTGLADRSHLLRADIGLHTHIADIVNLVRWESLDSIVLAGHSYGGFPVSGAIEQILDRVASAVFVDAFLPEDGQKTLDLASDIARDAMLEAIAKGEIASPAPAAARFAVNERDQAWVDAMLTPQPLGASTQTIKLSGLRERVAKKSYIRAAKYQQPRFDAYFQAKKADPSWRTYEVPCGHDVMIDMPERLAEILLEVA